MPEVTIEIGGRRYDVTCQNGEEHFLQAAAKALDAEAQTLREQIGRMPEARLLLMAGLMLADRAAGVEDQLRDAEARAGALRAEIESLRARPPAPPERVEVPVVPPALAERLAELAARAEALAGRVDEGANAVS